MFQERYIQNPGIFRTRSIFTTLVYSELKFSNCNNNKFILLLQKGVYILMIGKNSMKHHYLKKIFTVTLIWKILLMKIKCTQKGFVKILK